MIKHRVIQILTGSIAALLVYSVASSKDYVLIKTSRLQERNVKEVLKYEMMRHYGVDTCLQKAGFKYPSDWNDKTQLERQVIAAEHLEIYDKWGRWILGEWKACRSIEDASKLYSVQAYEKEDWERMDLLLDDARLAEIQERMQRIDSEFEIIITSNISHCLYLLGIELDPEKGASNG